MVLTALRLGVLASKFLIVLFITRYIGVDDLGRFALLNSINFILPAFLGLGLITHIARESVAHSIEEVTASLIKLWQLIIVLYAITFALSLAVGQFLGINLFLISAGIILALLEQINGDTTQILINRKKPIIANFLMFLRIGGWVYAYIIAAFLIPELRTLEILIYFWITGQVLGLLLFIFVARAWPWIQEFQYVSKQWILFELKPSWIFWINSVADSLSSNADRVIISMILGFELTGVYVFFLQIFDSVRTIVYASIYQLRRPSMISAFFENKIDLHKKITLGVSKEATALSILLMVIIYTVLHFGIPYLERPLVTQYLWIAPYIMLAVILRILADSFSYGLFTAKKDKAFVVSSIIAMVFSLLCNVLFLPIFGIIGAAFSALIVAISIGIWRYHALSSFWNERIM